ncbi:nucleolar protein 14 homolog [Drosophila guanche]|uniref:Blast:Nucleolar protein 14 homolog n=1 Tax=Drosophila guanche TaxID=7266 RepID=A0A3B0JE46_DROGU|nr:nucleolar protein 14 homolog [Drosophila guanche]SPP80644.1 blast:Nucleolar protein 14 homolog [Drosophila guanche]
MGAKNKKANSDAVYAKKTVKSTNPFDNATAQSAKRQNPFDVHVNKEKFKILGRICKHDRGMPGVARSKALQKRTQTLGQQFAVKHKTNKFKDNRIGRHLSGDQLTESVMNARYLAEKMSQVRTTQKAQKFNLNDDELLTHRGQTLEEIEQYRDERSDDEELDDEALDADFTSAAHFGGDENETSPQDRQAAIDEMIAEQKRRKNEIDKEKNEVYELTEKLDANYKLLLPLVAKATKDEQEAKPPADAYDKLLKEMIFEPRGSVTDKLINPAELAKQEAERLERLENERLRRMRADGEDDEAENAKPKHRSADALDDGYFVAGGEEDDDTLAYDMEGNLGTHLASKPETKEDSRDEAVEEDGEEEEESEDDSEVSEAENYSDLNESEAESETEQRTQKKPKKAKPQATTTLDASIPFTIKMPKTYEDFTELLSSHAALQQATIVERIIKCNDPKLDGVNREHVVKLYCFLLQYIKDLFEDASEQDIRGNFQLLSHLMPHLQSLTQLNPERMSCALLDVLKEKFGEYQKNPKTYPTLDTLIYFKLVSNVYSTSDFRHPVATPTYVFMEHILARARVRTRQDIAMGLFVVAVALEFGSKSKRFLPAVFNFLEGILYISIAKRDGDKLEVAPPFELNGPFSKLLAIAATPESKSLEQQNLQAADLVNHTLTLDFKVRALDTTLCLIREALQLVGEHTGACYLAGPFIPLLARLRLKPYPEHVQQHHREATQLVQQLAEQKMKPVALAERKPKALRMLEPRFETVYDDKRRPKMSKEKEERAKLLHKIKREKKGAIREIRRDTAFVQELKLKQQLQSDKERHEKVKRIYQEASMQQGELNELARSKKRKK